jgi:hypothetical protein
MHIHHCEVYKTDDVIIDTKTPEVDELRKHAFCEKAGQLLLVGRIIEWGVLLYLLHSHLPSFTLAFHLSFPAFFLFD